MAKMNQMAVLNLNHCGPLLSFTLVFSNPFDGVHFPLPLLPNRKNEPCAFCC